MEKKVISILIGLLFLGTCPLFAAETVKKENAFKQIVSVEKRGLVNLLTSPAEIVYALKWEKKDHPKAWPVTYLPRFITNAVVRVSSSLNDFILLPWYVTWGDPTPLTRHFELPDYVWEKE
ncbi:MAG: hypothetical protein WC133_06015 [Candidatus Omnitrophota bacterium]